MQYPFLITSICTFLFACDSHNSNHKVNYDFDTLIDFKEGRTPQSFERKLDSVKKSDSTVKLNYTIYYDQDTFHNEYELPIMGKRTNEYKNSNSRSIIITLIDSFQFEFKENTITLSKYFFNDIHSVDEEQIIYFAPFLGIFREESAVWRSHKEVIHSHTVPLEDLYYFSEIINRHLEPYNISGPFYNLPSPPPVGEKD